MAPSTSAIYRKAAIWAARSEGEGLTPSQHAALEAWLAKDSRHLGAYLQCCAALARVGRLRNALSGE